MDWTYDKIKRRELERQKRVRKKPVYREDNLQMSCIRWFDFQYPNYRAIMHHSPNEGKRTESQGAKLKAMGMRAGFADLVLILPTDRYSFLAIELKAKGGRQSDSEKAWQSEAERYSGLYIIVRDIDNFIKIVSAYIDAAEDHKLKKQQNYVQGGYSEKLEEVVRGQVSGAKGSKGCNRASHTTTGKR